MYGARCCQPDHGQAHIVIAQDVALQLKRIDSLVTERYPYVFGYPRD